ncbi:MAG: PAS domain S-box protein [Crocinitomicaceae bacterium]|nr:PAS domain S-box protein [Crocinitomicaceae bacterium]
MSFWFNKDLKRNAIAIEIASNNRLTTQNITFHSYNYYYSNIHNNIINKDIEQSYLIFNNSINLLIYGGKDTKLTQGYPLIKESDETIIKLLTKIKKSQNDIFQGYKKIQKAKGTINSIHNNSQVVNAFDNFRNIIINNNINQLNKKLVDLYQKEGDEKKSYFQNSLLSLLLLNLTLLILTYFYLRKTLKPIEAITDYVKKLSEGELPKPIESNLDDEIGEIVLAMNSLGSNIEAASFFAENIGGGKLDTDITVFENKGKLSESLRSMRDSLAHVADEESKRNWATEGLAKFVDIIRSTDDIELFYNNILGNLIRYLNVNQGYLYIINDEKKEEPFMEIKAVYAYGKKKYPEEELKIHYKEGLVGQAWFDKTPLYYTEIPSNYVKITSGIGEALPTCILIIPLLINEEVVGAIEIASFKDIAQYERDFVYKLAETIAGAIQNVKVNERTKTLLTASQHQSEALLAQEEEIRQNMEEMQATQSEMERAQRAMRDALEIANKKEQEAIALQEEFEVEKNLIKAEFETQLAIINETAIVSKTDLKGNITYVNDMFCRIAKYTREELIGKPHNILRHEDMPAWAFEDLWKTISSGKIWKGQVKNKCKDGSHYWVQATISPVLGDNGKPIEYMAVRYLITEMKEQEEKLKTAMEQLAHKG